MPLPLIAAALTLSTTAVPATTEQAQRPTLTGARAAIQGAITSATPQAPLSRDHARDFDFVIGHWTIQNRRLRERLKGSTEWIRFEATSSERLILNGLGIEEEYRTDYWPGFIGMAFRFYNPATKQWSIYWADSIRGQLESPVVGSFSGDMGIFEGDDIVDGKPIRVRFIWSRIHSDSPRWEQAFSADGGNTWETNWVMDFTRVAPTFLSRFSHSMAGTAEHSVLSLTR